MWKVELPGGDIEQGHPQDVFVLKKAGVSVSGPCLASILLSNQRCCMYFSRFSRLFCGSRLSGGCQLNT